MPRGRTKSKLPGYRLFTRLLPESASAHDSMLSLLALTCATSLFRPSWLFTSNLIRMADRLIAVSAHMRDGCIW